MNAGEPSGVARSLETFVVTSQFASELCVVGELDLATVERLNDVVDQLLAKPCPALLVDLTGVTFMDAAGLGGLVRLRNRMQANRVAALLVFGENQPRRLVRVCGMEAALIGGVSAEPPPDKAVR